jgi:hypothetical protein
LKAITDMVIEKEKNFYGIKQGLPSPQENMQPTALLHRTWQGYFYDAYMT